MNATRTLHELGQSLWLDNITRELLETGTLKRYIDELSVTGLTSNPTIFDNTINTMPEKTLLAFADHGQVDGAIPREGGDAKQVLAAFTRAGFDLDQLAARLQKEGAESFVASWRDLMGSVESKGKRLG